MMKLIVAPMMVAALFAAAVHADQSMKVSFAGLDLDTPAGATELLARIATAAHTVCDAWDSSNSDSHRECLNKAVKAAVKQINRPQVTTVAENFKP